MNIPTRIRVGANELFAERLYTTAKSADKFAAKVMEDGRRAWVKSFKLVNKTLYIVYTM